MSLTGDLYSHVTPAMLDKAADVLESSLASGQ
jgi:hypothetical protein